MYKKVNKSELLNNNKSLKQQPNMSKLSEIDEIRTNIKDILLSSSMGVPLKNIERKY